MLYKTNIGLIFSVTQSNYYSTISIFLVNGKPVEQFNSLNGKTWYITQDSEIKTLSVLQDKPAVALYWQLKEDDPLGVLPKRLEMTELSEEYDEETEEKIVVGKYKSYFNSYEKVYSEPTQEYVNQEFEIIFQQQIEISNFSVPQKLNVQVISNRDYGKTVEVDLKSIATIDELYQLLTPEFLHHEIPVSLSSKQVYSIVRAHIKHIFDPKKFVLSSDYDFCFVVEKLVNHKPKNVIVSKSVKKGKSWVEKQVPATLTSKKIKVFEMTWAGYKGSGGYDGYTCIAEWKANSLMELYNKINSYLEELSEFLLTDLHECEHCNGLGFHVHKFDMNKR